MPPGCPATISSAWTPAGTLETANDGDGRDDDASDPGDWCTGNGVDQASSWHGTAVAGIIAAQVNGYGGVGVAPGVRILPVRAIGRCGGYMSDVVDAMRWAAGLPVAGAPANPNPARVLNLSLGSAADSPCSLLQQQAVDEIVAANVMVVAAAGNEGVNGMGAPANCDQVIAVAAHTRQGELRVVLELPCRHRADRAGRRRLVRRERDPRGQQCRTHRARPAGGRPGLRRHQRGDAACRRRRGAAVVAGAGPAARRDPQRPHRCRAADGPANSACVAGAARRPLRRRDARRRAARSAGSAAR